MKSDSSNVKRITFGNGIYGTQFGHQEEVVLLQK